MIPNVVTLEVCNANGIILQCVVTRFMSVLPKNLHNFRSWGGGGGEGPVARTLMPTKVVSTKRSCGSHVTKRIK